MRGQHAFRLSKHAHRFVLDGWRGKRESSLPNTDGASKSSQQLSMGSGPYVLTVLPLACSPPLGKYSERPLCTHSSCSTRQVSIALVFPLSSFYASASPLT